MTNRTKIAAFLLLPFLVASCGKEKTTEVPTASFPENSAIFGLGSPIQLEASETVVELGDYFEDPGKIDSIDLPNSLGQSRSEDGRTLKLIPKMRDIPPRLSVMTLWVEGAPYSLLLKRTRKVNRILTFDPQGKEYTKVQIKGSFNGWNPENTNMTLNKGIWSAGTVVQPGSYQYLIVADGKEMLDPASPDKVANGMGGFNSVLKIGNQGESTNVPHLLVLDQKDNSFRVYIDGKDVEPIVFWENHQLDTAFVRREGPYLSITLPIDAEKKDRSYVRIWAANPSAVSNDLLIPLEKGKLVTDSDQLTRADKEANVMYFILVDRFVNGDTANDQRLEDPRVKDKANYWGGDLAGVLAKMKDGYFDDLGINCLWISPITQNPEEAFQEYPEPRRWFSGYHGYWPISSSKVDHRFGNAQVLKDLVSEAHARGINILLDFVANHVHEQHPIYQNHPDWVTQLDLPDGRKNIRIWDEQRLTTWFDLFMPSLNFSRPEVIATQVDSAFFWIKEFGLDGFRHDATKHIPESFWRALTHKLKYDYAKPEGKPVYQIGETFGSRELIASYISTGQLDAQFDFNLYFDARDIFARDEESFERLDASLQQTFDYYGQHNSMGNITGNHDMPRFISYASGALSYEEDPKEAGWNRDIQVKDNVGYTKLSSLTAFLMTIPGVPILYYGDEIGAPGAGDPDNRRPMKFSGLSLEEAKVKENATKLARLRRSAMPLLYGDFQTLQATPTTYAYGRGYLGELFITLLNKSDQAMTIELEWPANYTFDNLKAHFGSQIEMKEGILSVEVPAYGFEVVSNQGAK